MNYRIRRAIEGYIQANGQQDTRDVIALFAKRFNTTKQRISGNISCMKCREQSINIIPNKPHSIMYQDTHPASRKPCWSFFMSGTNRFLI